MHFAPGKGELADADWNWQMRTGSQIHRRTIMKNVSSTENWSESLNMATEISLEVI